MRHKDMKGLWYVSSYDQWHDFKTRGTWDPEMGPLTTACHGLVSSPGLAACPGSWSRQPFPEVHGARLSQGSSSSSLGRQEVPPDVAPCRSDLQGASGSGSWDEHVDLGRWAAGVRGNRNSCLIVPSQAGNGAGSKPGDILDVLTQYRGLSWR